MRGLCAISCAALAACATASAEVSRDANGVMYQSVETELLDDDLLNVRVVVDGVSVPDESIAYARCVAAQQTVVRGYGFLRHIRTTTEETARGQRADAIYTLSPALPAGAKTIDAEVTVADCVASGIPTV